MISGDVAEGVGGHRPHRDPVHQDVKDNDRPLYLLTRAGGPPCKVYGTLKGE